MVNPELDEIRTLKRRATALRNRGRLEAARKTLDDALDRLKALLDTEDLARADALQLRAELADTYGMKGGVQRREGDLLAALESYEKGRVVEKEDRQSTYNLSNVVALRITEKRASPQDPEMRQDLEQAIAHLKAETGGPRRDEWWAWSDLAQFHLLNGQPGEARACYAAARARTGVTPEEIRRHVTILRELADKSAATAPGIASDLRAAVQELERHL